MRCIRSNNTLSTCSASLYENINKTFDKSTSYNEVILAYEPLWSIGTGLTPKIDEIEEISSYLSKILKNYSFYQYEV